MSIDQILLTICAALIIGGTKAGLKGMGIIAVALLAIAFDAKQSSGMMVPLLLVGDVFAVWYYNKHVKWKYLKKFLPALLVGIGLGAWFGSGLSEYAFRKWLSGIILISVLIMFWREFKTLKVFPEGWLFEGSTGIAAGFTTMIGNAAGAFSNLFFLSTGLPKNEIIGTSGWLFLIVNLVKLPIHIFVWNTLDWETSKNVAMFVPAIFVGFFLGFRLVALINETYYRYFLLVATAIGGLLLLF